VPWFLVLTFGWTWIWVALAMDIPLYPATFALGSRVEPRFPAVGGALLGSLPGLWVSGFAASFPTSGLGEELGWRGLLLPRQPAADGRGARRDQRLVRLGRRLPAPEAAAVLAGVRSVSVGRRTGHG
jgi:membrane protease YdiL (CAAX protease family)